MECGAALLVLMALGVVVLPFVLLGMQLSDRARLKTFENRLSLVEKGLVRRPATPPAPAAAVVEPPRPVAASMPPPAPVPQPLRAAEPPRLAPPPPAPELPAAPAVVRPAVPARAEARVENFLGLKLSAWIGAVLAFLAVVFFVKYSFDHNLITPPMRVALGGVVGLVTLGIGLRLDRVRYRFLVQALCSASLLIFYGTLFAAHGLYDLIPQAVAFGLMALVTAAAFVLAVRLEAIAVAVLGVVGGFMTPPLLSTGVDKALGLFTYVALLDVGLLAIACRRKWPVLVPLAAAGTTFLQLGWVASFLSVEKVPTSFAIFAVFPWLFAGAFLLLRREKIESVLVALGGLFPAFLSLIYALGLITSSVGAAVRTPDLLGAFLLVVDLAVLLPAVLHAKVRAALPAAGLFFFAILGVWVARFLEASTLPLLLLLTLVFAVLHGVLPVVVERIRPGAPGAGAWSHLFAPLALLLALDPILHLPGPPILLWPFILLLAAAALLTAWLTRWILGFAAMVGLTMVALGLALFRVPLEGPLPPFTLLLVGAFGILFAAAAQALLRSRPTPERHATLLPALSAMLPFALLMLAVARLSVPDPSPVFALAALLAAVAGAAIVAHRADELLWVLLIAIAGLEFTWHVVRFDTGAPTVPIAWYFGFLLLFFLFPFVAGKRMDGRRAPWIVSALAGPIQFLLLFETFRAALPWFPRGLLALGFAGLYVAGLARLVRAIPAGSPARAAALASFGGVALLFLTAAIPIQFDRQWITVGWALEGAALLWLFRRVPYPGLRIAGALLLGAAFVRLLPGINPYLLHYAERGPVPILNWFLYTYGIVAACQFAGARLIDRERPKILDVNARAALPATGTILLFLLVNLEIADVFSAGERYLVFQFPSSLAQDMAYSIAWAVFALTLLAVGVRARGRAIRYSGLGLLIATFVKVSLYDLWQLGGLYRVGSLIGLAIVLLLVSYLYHRFVAGAAPGKA